MVSKLNARNAAVAASTSPSKVPTTPGVIRPDEVYTLEEFKGRVGFKDAALRAARRNSLKTLEAHGRKFVRGQDWIDYLARMQKADPSCDGSADT
jgi:hypothetical protein